MNVLGIGCMSAAGRGVEALEQAMRAEPNAPDWVDVPFLEEPFPVFQVPADALKDRAVLKGMRRADRFSKMVVLAAYDAMQSAACSVDPARMGIIFASAFGPHKTTFSFLDEILDYGDAAVSPTVFSHSVHGAAVSYLSNMLNCTGPTWSVTQFTDPFEQALTVAQAWLDEGRVETVLLGAGDECGPAMEYSCKRKLPIAANGVVRLEEPKQYVPGEGAAFMLLSQSDEGATFPAETIATAPWTGNMLTGAAFDGVVAAGRADRL